MIHVVLTCYTKFCEGGGNPRGMGLSTKHRRERPAWDVPLLRTPQCRGRSIPQGGGDMMVVRVCLGHLSECPHSMYYVLYTALVHI